MSKSDPLPTAEELQGKVQQVLQRVIMQRKATDAERDVLIDAAVYAPQLLDGHRIKLLEADVKYPYVFYAQPTEEEFQALVARQQRFFDTLPHDISDPNGRLSSRSELLMGATPAFGQQILRWREQTVDSGWFDASGQHEAARSLTKQGNLRELFYRPSIELDVMKDDPLPDEQHVGPFDLDECCSRCSTPLFAVVAAETTGRLAFLSHLGPTIVVPLCPTCVYEHRSTSARIDYAMPERTTPDPSAARLVLGFSLPLFGGWRRRTSHVGGFPRWEQYPEFPKCPDCRRAMRFLMKVNGHSLGWGYHDPMCFVCDKCRTFSTLVQTD